MPGFLVGCGEVGQLPHLGFGSYHLQILHSILLKDERNTCVNFPSRPCILHLVTHLADSQKNAHCQFPNHPKFKEINLKIQNIPSGASPDPLGDTVLCTTPPFSRDIPSRHSLLKILKETLHAV